MDTNGSIQTCFFVNADGSKPRDTFSLCVFHACTGIVHSKTTPRSYKIFIIFNEYYFKMMVLKHTMIFGNLKNNLVNIQEHMGGYTFEHLQCRQTLVFRKLKFFVVVHLMEPKLIRFDRDFDFSQPHKMTHFTTRKQLRFLPFSNIHKYSSLCSKRESGQWKMAMGSPKLKYLKFCGFKVFKMNCFQFAGLQWEKPFLFRDTSSASFSVRNTRGQEV